MSTCPSKNIHSLYIDGELPQPYKNSFEEHLSQCAKCAKQQQLYMSIDDSLHDSICEQDHEGGYLRLKARLSYKEVIAPERFFSFGSCMLKTVPLMAVALIFALFLPLNFSRTSTNQNAIIANLSDDSFLTNFLSPYNSVQVVPIQQQGIVVNGNIPQVKLASMLRTSHAIDLNAPKLTEIDVFMPELPASAAQIQITLFHVSDMPMMLIAELTP